MQIMLDIGEGKVYTIDKVMVGEGEMKLHKKRCLMCGWRHYSDTEHLYLCMKKGGYWIPPAVLRWVQVYGCASFRGVKDERKG